MATEKSERIAQMLMIVARIFYKIVNKKNGQFMIWMRDILITNSLNSSFTSDLERSFDPFSTGVLYKGDGR